MHDLKDAEGKAAFTLHNIEGRTAHIVAQIKRVVEILHSHQGQTRVKAGSVTLTSMALPKLTIADLEAHQKHWKFLIPEDAKIQARILHLMGEKYPLSEKKTPEILAAIGYDKTRVISAFKDIYGKAINTIIGLHAPEKKVKPKKLSKKQAAELEIMHEIESELEWVFIRRQDTLFRQGDAGDSLYVISDGLLRVVREADDGSEMLLAEFGRNQIIGEMAIITGEPRTATIYAVRDSELCRLSKQSFERLNKKFHVLMTEIAVQITQRLRQVENFNLRLEKPSAITVIPISPNSSQFASRLAAVLSRETSVLHLSRERMKSYVPSAMAEALDSDDYEYELSAWLDEQDTNYEIVIYEADLEATQWSDRCIQRADRLLLVGTDDSSPKLSDVETKILQAQDPRLLVRQELILLHADRENQPAGTAEWLNNRNVDRHHHVSLIDNDDVERVARFLRGKATGLVLGGGGTRGAAHAGVMRALEESDITVDIIGGTSAGAVYGALMALGNNAEETLMKIRNNLVKRRVLLDYTLPLAAMSTGRRLYQGYRKVYGDVKIEDLWLPFYCVSVNVTSAQMAVHQMGELAHYVRASSSIPGIYPPIVEANGSLLVDGGLFDNVPIDVMTQLNHGGTIIAVDIGHHDDSEQPYDFGDSISGWKILWRRINPFKKAYAIPGIFELITRVVGLSDSSQAKTRFRHADLLIRPHLSQFATFDVKNQYEIYEIGYREALEKIEGWQTEESEIE